MENIKTPLLMMGAEYEFWVDRGISSSDLIKYGIINEYYSGMYEKNTFITQFETKQDILTFFDGIRDNMIMIKKELGAVITTRGLSLGDTMVFNGLHLHLSIDGANSTATRELYQYLTHTNKIVNWKLSNYPSVRSLLSHHIWGNSTRYCYNYQSRDKFKPVLYTGLGTCELRLLDVEDILSPTRAKKLAGLLYKIMVEGTRPSVSSSTSNKFKIGEMSTCENIVARLQPLIESKYNRTREGTYPTFSVGENEFIITSDSEERPYYEKVN